MSRLSLSLLGSFQVTLEGKPITEFTTDKVRALLAYLAVEADRSHRRDVLAGMFWPGWPEDAARNNLRQALFQLRQVLGDRETSYPFLLTNRQTIQFNPAGDYWLDVRAFTTLILDCRAHRHSRLEACDSCIARLSQAAELYRGDFLEQFLLSDNVAFEEWALLTREWLRRQALETFFHLAAYHERRGEYERAGHYARRQVALDPLREEGHRQLMRAMALSGQRNAALAQYQACCQLLAEELGVEPAAETTVLYERIRDGELGRGPEEGVDVAARLYNLPVQLTPFVGREEELAQITGRLENPACRLLTLVGPGGSGKTRLALQIAVQQVGVFPDGVYLVPLTPVRSTDLLASTIVSILDFSFHDRQDPELQLLDYLRTKKLLLILDGFEHLLPLKGADLLTRILRAAPGVKILVTSRERLNLHGEWLFEVYGLRYPERRERGFMKRAWSETGPSPEAGEVDSLEDYDAVELFLQSARRARADFSLSPEAASDVIRICQLVEGMPLGIELAAAWVSMFSCGEIAEQIQRNWDFLTTSMRDVPKRHQSMRAVFEHSWNLLSEEEKCVFRRLSVFRGGFRREAAEQVAGGSLSLLAALVYKSLVRTDPSGRLEVHEILRQYAEEKLQEVPQEADRLRDLHCNYYAEFLQQREECLKGGGQRRALEDIGEEVENVRGGWDWAVARGREDVIGKSLESLFLFCEMRGWFRDGEETFRKAAQGLRERGRAASMVYWKLLARQGRLSHQVGLPERAQSLLQDSLAVFRDLGSLGEVAFCLNYLGEVARRGGDYTEARKTFRESLTLCREIGDQWGIVASLNNLGLTDLMLEEPLEARQRFQESLAICRQTGNQWGMVTSLNGLGYVACALGERRESWACFLEALGIGMDIWAVPALLHALAGMAELLERGGEEERAVELLSLVLYHPATYRHTGSHAEALLSQLKLQLPFHVVTLAQERGRGRKLDEVVKEILNNHWGEDGTGTKNLPWKH